MSHESETMERRKPSVWSSKLFVASAALIGVLAVAGVVLVATGGEQAPSSADPSQAPTTSPTKKTPSDPDASVCGLRAGSQAIPAEAPEATWELVGAVAAPSSDDAGPGLVDPDGLRRCYQHSPTGAVFAAANRLAVSSVPELQVRALEELVAPGRVRDLVLEEVERVGLEDLTAQTGPVAQIAAFQVRDYTTDTAIVDVVTRTPDGALVALPTTLEWADGDWKVVLTASSGTDASPVPDLAGYVEWTGLS